MVLTTEARDRIATVAFDFEAAAKRPIDRCNLCGGRKFESVSRRDRYGFPASAALCTRCGLVFLDPVLTEEAYGAFYRHVYRPLVSAYHGRRIDAETIETGQRAYANDVIAALEPFHEDRTRSTLLDVGGSTGVVAEAVARRFDLRATVLDPAPAEAERAAARRLETIVGTVEGFDPGGRRFDVILLCQTIDHLLDVGGALAKLRAILAEDGILFVDVVDWRVPMRRAGRVSEGIKVDHPYSLSPETADAFLRRAGFESLRAARAEDGLHVTYVCAPSRPQADALPSPSAVDALRRELAALGPAEDA